MASKSILFITGANTGIGLETVKALLQSPKAYTILLGGRNLDKANAAVRDVQSQFPDSSSTVTAVQVDIEDDNSISQAFDRISQEHQRLDVLINNAGAAFDGQVAEGKLTMREMWNKSWDLNTVGTHILTHTFIPLLLKSSDPRLLFITSGTSTLTDSGDTSVPINISPPKGWPKQGFSLAAYRSSKTGMNMMVRDWVRTLKADDVKIWAISPGFLATGLGGDQERNKKMGAGDPALGGSFIRDVVEGARDADTGLVVRRGGVQPW
ncbi:alcohol dehydrogenase [Exophiala aquamarina CBS 119918]|uniref:Alcohol dehydrogenase n=1 Tax=Exophiala aquamarina CBS 119918 TaxID=1182545 RepID=A0A072P4X7_9EURO|nr:alcohol dehydrogenase [Exophiala aquamarina CBS 119918]KEF55169.1 alcohol dehydrogenase [Exophiala aquamarina CBS 119918]